MIKINLAKRKQFTASAAAYAPASKAPSEPKGPNVFQSVGRSLSSSIDSSGIVTLLTRVLIPCALAVGGYFAFDQYVTEQRANMAADLQRIQSEKSKIQSELNRIAGFETVKNELEQNEKILTAKVDTMQKLLSNRDFAFKSLVSISNSLPREVWLHELVENDQGFEIKGNATEVGLVGDLMTRLSESAIFKDVSLKSTAHDPAQNQATFELTARRE